MKQVEERYISFEASKMAYRDIKNSVDTAKREGIEIGRAEGKHEANTETAFSPYLNHMRKFSLDKLHQILKKMACRKNSIDNEQDNIMYFATFVVYLPPKRTNKRVDSKNNI